MRDIRDQLRWCKTQTKGIRIVAPSENLVKAYRKKSQDALKSMEVNADAGIPEWAISTAYYAKYFAVYALICKIGVKCEIHDCTVALFEHLFGGTVKQELINELRRSKEDRVDHQYYPQQAKVNLEEVVKNAKNFVLEIEKVLDSMSSASIAVLQQKIKQLSSTVSNALSRINSMIFWSALFVFSRAASPSGVIEKYSLERKKSLRLLNVST